MPIRTNESIRLAEAKIQDVLTRAKRRGREGAVIAARAEKTRTAFRGAVRRAADRKLEFYRSSGEQACQDWVAGFSFAQSLPPDSKVEYFKFDGARDAVLFFSEAALAKLAKAVEKHEYALDNIENLASVDEVMSS